MKELIERMKKDPFAQYLGISIDEVKEGYAKVSMEVKEHLLNFHGSTNGGAIFSLADVAFACASNSHNQVAVGITMTMHYMKASFAGEKLMAIAQEETQPHRLGLYRITVVNEKEELIALAEGMVYRKKEPFVSGV
ncbi:hydroxyphenylacetyl-CoA thioesterase PaaI [Anoxybacteroides tepidamans]|uniref:hydroxyphenylacetyl-CoA thioesterase PaaI n=1 Tax=Anoxybacteroides tepidamans TaxID=265948 RepID=UPI000484DBA0|nr:hydroxyphenylacetyl-CoA thioesterase PaaI [Anoxybacillus tepidamans]